MGAAIVYAIRERHYLHLLGTYLLCVALHGLWNGLAIMFTFSSMASLYAKKSLLSSLSTPFAVALGVFAILLLALLILSNRRIRAKLPKPALEEPIP
jgi:membrane protein implicated in regulation of membrane protease activity